MSVKPIVPRKVATADVEEAIDYYVGEQAFDAAMGFIDELEKAYRQIARQPGAGSPRYIHELGLPGLRFWQLRKYPFLVFYVELTDRIDVWRVLHAQRDIPAWLSQ